MDELTEDFRALKISALRKAYELSPHIHDVTLGPNCTANAKRQQKEIPKQQSVKKNVPNVKVTASPIGGVSPLKKLLIELETQRKETVQEAVNLRQKKIAEFHQDQENEQKFQWYRQQQKIIDQVHSQELQILQALEEHDKDVSMQHQRRVEYYQELAERRKKKDEELQAKEQRKRELYNIMDSIKRDQVEFRTVYQEIINILKTRVIHNDIKAAITEISQELKTIPTSMEDVINKCKMGKISSSEAERSSELLQHLLTIKTRILKVIDDYNKEKEEQLKREAEKIAVELAKPVVPQPSENKTMDKAENVATKIDYFISKSSLKTYSELREFLEAQEQHCKDFEQNESLKQFKFDCKKAVNIPVNAISAVSPQHLIDKYNRLANLLSGKPVSIGDLHISAGNHPQGVAFCMNLLAKKFVLQGDLMISGNPEAAFCYATVILSLWNDFPEFGKLLLAHFHKQCPYLVPFYIPKAIGQTDEEYYKNLGYQYVNGIVEKQDKFLKRMTGIMRLYSAILISKPKRSQSRVNPHGLSQAWRWLAAVLNLEPRVDITATMLHVFLETAGHKMQATYGKEFKTAIHFIIEGYLPMMKKIDSGGPVSRLEVLLQEYRLRGNFEKPSGVLPDNFW